MGADHILPGWFTLDRDITVAPDGSVTVAPGSAEALGRVLDQFAATLPRTPLYAAAS